MAQTSAMVAVMPFNAAKAAEHGLDNGVSPPHGAAMEPASRLASGITLTESAEGGKLGTEAADCCNPGNASPDRVRVDSTGQAHTTNQGVAQADKQNSLQYGVRGLALREDFILRVKIAHFDHERIPEGIIHARGSVNHSYFECYEPCTQHTKAAPFQETAKITPMFIRFSTVSGERGSKDTAQDMRGFAI